MIFRSAVLLLWYPFLHMFNLETLTALLTLTGMEIVLGIDNIIFISILVGRLPEAQRDRARVLGLGLALVSRLILLSSISWIVKLTNPVLEVANFVLSWRDLILIGGGIFLVGKATMEIHHKVVGDSLPGAPEKDGSVKKSATFSSVLMQIAILDIIFSLDSVITAVGMVDELWVMVLAVLISMAVMVFAAKSIGDFVERNPTLKVLALSFLILIGVVLIVEGGGGHISKGAIYFAMAFSLLVELINLRVRKNFSIHKN